MSLNAFIERFNGMTEPYFFYDGTIELRYEPNEHVYYRIVDGEFVAQDGVTTVVHIIDKSDALIPWGCKMMAAKLLATMPITVTPLGDRVLRMDYADFEKLVLAAKNAHKEKLEEAANIGSAAHAWIEQYIKSVLAENEPRKMELLAKFPEDDRAKNCCHAALDWMQQHNVRWICTERKVFSAFYEYAGTMDGLARVDSCEDPICCPVPFKNRLSLIDWKSSNYLYLEYLFQTAAYQHAYQEEQQCLTRRHGVPAEDVNDRWIIRLGKEDAEFDPWHLEGDTFEQDFQGFKDALELCRSVKSVKLRMRDRLDVIKAEMKLRAQKAKEEALKIKCKGAAKYKGIRPPRCNGGNPCQSCLTKYEAVQREKLSASASVLIATTLSA